MKRPPVQGMPSEQPHCPWCNRRLKFWTKDEYKDGKQFGDVIARTFHAWTGYPNSNTPIFDRLTCAVQFATACHKAGYRRAKQ
jgi:hypothetical protein